jgi:sugar-phosphatase
MDGLLINTEPYWQKTELQLSAELGIQLTEEMQKETLGLRTDEQIMHWYLHKPWPDPDFKKIENRFDEIILNYFLEEAELMEGAEYILNFFSSTGLKMALASSSSYSLINAFLDRFGFRNFFQCLHSAQEEKHGKPHPEVYLKTAAKLGEKPSTCLAFEDSLHGVVAARAARMKIVAVPDKKHFDDPGYGIADLKLKSLSDFGKAELTLLTQRKLL